MPISQKEGQPYPSQRPVETRGNDISTAVAESLSKATGKEISPEVVRQFMGETVMEQAVTRQKIQNLAAQLENTFREILKQSPDLAELMKNCGLSPENSADIMQMVAAFQETGRRNQ